MGRTQKEKGEIVLLRVMFKLKATTAWKMFRAGAALATAFERVAQ